MLASVTSRAKRSGRMAASARPFSPSAFSARRSARERAARMRAPRRPWPRWAARRRTRPSSAAPSRWRSSSSSSAAVELADELLGAEQAGVAAEPEHPGDDPARVGVAGREHRLARPSVADLPVAAEVAFDLPGDPLGDLDLGDALAPRRAASRRGWRRRAGRSPPGGGSRARPWSRRRPCPGSARAGTRGSPCARGSRPSR